MTPERTTSGRKPTKHYDHIGNRIYIGDTISMAVTLYSTSAYQRLGLVSGETSQYIKLEKSISDGLGMLGNGARISPDKTINLSAIAENNEPKDFEMRPHTERVSQK